MCPVTRTPHRCLALCSSGRLRAGLTAPGEDTGQQEQVQDGTAKARIEGMGRIAARGGMVTLGGQGVSFVLQLISLVVLSHLLTPTDFGTFAMVTAIVGVGEVLRDFGLSSAAVQAPSLSKQQRSNLFWLNLAIGVALSVIVFFLAGPISAFYSNPGLMSITQWLSLTFVFNGVGTQYGASLVRGFRFGTLAWTELLAVGLAFGASTTVALMGAGTAALVTQALAYSALVSLLRVASSRWLPTFPRSAPMRSLLSYGGNLMGSQLIGYASRNIDSVIVGWKFGAVPLGIYNRAFQLLTAPLNQISAPLTKVALPVFARLAPDHHRFTGALVRTQCVLAYAVVTVFAVLFTVADSLVLLLFGDQWTAVPPVFRILALAGVFQIFTYSSYWVFLATGLVNWNLRYAMVSRVIVIGAIVIGSFWGYLGVAAGYAISLAILWPICQWWIGLKVVMPQRALFGVGGRALLVGAAGVVVGLLVLRWFPTPGIVQLMVGTLATLLGSGLVVAVHRRLRTDLWTVICVVQLMYRKN
jgi:polysaccharide transporter, PST family